MKKNLLICIIFVFFLFFSIAQARVFYNNSGEICTDASNGLAIYIAFVAIFLLLISQIIFLIRGSTKLQKLLLLVSGVLVPVAFISIVVLPAISCH